MTHQDKRKREDPAEGPRKLMNASTAEEEATGQMSAKRDQEREEEIREEEETETDPQKLDASDVIREVTRRETAELVPDLFHLEVLEEEEEEDPTVLDLTEEDPEDTKIEELTREDTDLEGEDHPLPEDLDLDLTLTEVEEAEEDLTQMSQAEDREKAKRKW